MAYHSFLLEPISCHAWNKDRTRKYGWGTPKSPRTSRGTVLTKHPCGGRCSLDGAALGWGWVWGSRSCHGQIWGLGQHIFPHVPWSHCRDRAWHRGASTVSGPRHRQGRDGHGAEPGDSRPMAFPDYGPGDVGEQKGLSLLRPERRAGEVEWGWIWELCTRSRPIPSCPILSCPIPPAP